MTDDELAGACEAVLGDVASTWGSFHTDVGSRNSTLVGSESDGGKWPVEDGLAPSRVRAGRSGRVAEARRARRPAWTGPARRR